MVGRKSHTDDEAERCLYTIGHSTHTLDELVDLLNTYDIQLLADIRSLPGSRRLPHFNAENLATELPARGIEYLPFKQLGGRRKGLKDSPNTGWHHPAFRSYADYMATPEFAAGLKKLLKLAARRRVAIMCAEAVPWRCHRNLVADAAVLLHGWQVRHIMSARQANAHKPMEFARVQGDHLVYPADDLLTDA